MAASLIFAPAALPQAAGTGGDLQSSTDKSAVKHDQGWNELQLGTQLTHSGELREAIPHLLAAQSAGADAYATSVNLAICYLGTGTAQKAIPLLESARRTPTTATLLVQSYIAAGRLQDAYATLAASQPAGEKMFAYAADACTDHRQYAAGLHMMNLGITKLPDSARLHYEKALFLAELGRIEEARPEFNRATQLDPNGYIGYLALVQKELYDGELAAANQTLRKAMQAGNRDYRFLSLLGTVLLQEGAAPGDPAFAEAQSVLEESARERPDYSATQIALGKIYLMQSRYADAVEHLEIGRALEPDNPAVYTSLAAAYRALGEREKASRMSEQLGVLLERHNMAADDGGVRVPR